MLKIIIAAHLYSVLLRKLVVNIFMKTFLVCISISAKTVDMKNKNIATSLHACGGDFFSLNLKVAVIEQMSACLI